MIDLLAHYDAVAELMAAMGGWLENRAGSFNSSALSYGRKFSDDKMEGKCRVGNGEEWWVYSLPVACRG